jgi:hypothetical protein
MMLTSAFDFFMSHVLILVLTQLVCGHTYAVHSNFDLLFSVDFLLNPLPYTEATIKLREKPELGKSDMPTV